METFETLSSVSIKAYFIYIYKIENVTWINKPR